MRRLARDAQVRDSEGLFVVEGPRLVQEAIEAGLKIDQVILPEDELDDAFSLYRCHGIMNCVSVCPKGLNPTEAISNIRKKLINRKG